jgi:aspartate racemase
MESTSQSQHIGIVACTAEGASLCYRTICAEAPGVLAAHEHPEISLHNLSLARYVKYLDEGDARGVANLMLESSRKLKRAGADFLICPDNTIHMAFDIVEAESPLPWLHIAEVVADEASKRGFRKLGLTGTHWLVNSDVYPSRLKRKGLAFERLGAAEREEMGRVIMEQLVYGDFRSETIRFFQSAISELREKGCDAVVLGCTEIPLIIDDSNSPLPTLDSTRLLARAAMRRACA